MHKAYVHAVSVVAEKAYFILVHKVATMATDEPVTKPALYRFGGTSQHVIT